MPRRQIALAKRVAQALGDHAQQPVAGRMAEGVVDVLEQVEIDAGHRQSPGSAAARLDRSHQMLAEIGAVAEAGQRVVASEISRFRFGAPALGDVDDRDQLRRAAVVGDVAGESERVDGLAVGAAMALVAPDLARAGGLRGGAREVFRVVGATLRRRAGRRRS